MIERPNAFLLEMCQLKWRAFQLIFIILYFDLLFFIYIYFTYFVYLYNENVIV